MNPRHFQWFLWAFALLLLMIAMASFVGDLMSTGYGVLALVLACAIVVIAFFRRRLDDLTGLSTPVRTGTVDDSPPWKDKRRTTVEWLVSTAFVLWAVFAGLSTALVLAVFLGCIAVVATIEMILITRWMRRNQAPRT